MKEVFLKSLWLGLAVIIGAGLLGLIFPQLRKYLV